MKQSYFYILILLLSPIQSIAVINELSQFQQSLQKITTFLAQTTKAIKPKITTYEELKKVIDEAYTTKNLNLLYSFEQTVALTTAKYLLEEFFKEGPRPENRPAYIPLIAYITEQVIEQYPDKNIELRCVSLAAGNLENEFLLIRALRFVGYKNIRLIAIDILYNSFEKAALLKQFDSWCNLRTIPLAYQPKPLLQDSVNIELFADTYYYMTKVYNDVSRKNHLLLMIQPTSAFSVQFTKDEIISNIEKQTITPNYLNFENATGLRIEIYLPFKKSDFFVISTYINTKENREIKNIKQVIKDFPDTLLYQKNLMIKLVNNFFDVTRDSASGSDPYLSFYDLIKYTALDTAKPLAFQTMNLNMTQITDMSGTLQEVYDRYGNN